MAQKTAPKRDELDREGYHNMILECCRESQLLPFANGIYIQDERNGNMDIQFRSLKGNSLELLDKHFKINWIDAEIDNKTRTAVAFLALEPKTSLKDRAKSRTEKS